jgi:hypothetical protein
MFRRRRPLMRAAAVGGAAYYAGKKVQEGRDEQALDELEEGQEPDSGAITDAQIEQLQKLSDLKTAGVLTEDEFEAQKQKILGA